MANVFYLAGFIEAWGSGYEKIRDAFKAENLEMPVFEEVRGGFMATIKREKFMEIQKGHNVTMSLVMSVVLSVVLSVVPRTIWHDLADMQKKGVLIRNRVRKPCEDLVM